MFIHEVFLKIKNKSSLNEASKRKKYKSTHKLKVTEKFLLKKNNSYGEEIERIKSNICAMLAKRVNLKTKNNN